jgi:hypothetical protein
MQENKKVPTNELLMRTKFQWFLSKALHSFFKKLIVSTPLLLQGLHTMSLSKLVPDRLKPRECKQLRLREPPPVPYVPTKDEVQKEVSKMQNLQIKTSIKKDTTLNFSVWHENQTREAFLMHVMAVLDAIKKCGHFKDYEKAQKADVENKQVVELVRAGLALLDGTVGGSRKNCKNKALAKAKEAAKEAKAKTPETEAETKEAKGATKVPKDPMKAGFQADLEKAKKAILKRVGLSYLQAGLMSPLTSAVAIVTGNCQDLTSRCHNSDTLF